MEEIEPIVRSIVRPKNSFFVIGPRGVGKSVWVRAEFPKALYIDLQDLEFERVLRPYPERLANIIRQHDVRQIVLDDVQRVPELLDVVASMLKVDPNLQFVMVASNLRKLRGRGGELFGGLTAVRILYPYTLYELGVSYSLEKALKYGLLPRIHATREKEEVLKAYVRYYVIQEVRAEGLARKIGDFSRFLEVLSFSHAKAINISHIARKADIRRKTAENYLDVIEDLLFGFRLHVFNQEAKRELLVHPKFYFFDNGIYRTLRPNGLQEPVHEIMGPALEGIVAHHLRAWCEYSKGKHQLYCWRTKAQEEVDFVINGTSGLSAIDVKAGSTVTSEDLQGLKLFKRDYPEAQCALIYQGDERKTIETVLCIPVENFLKSQMPDA